MTKLPQRDRLQGALRYRRGGLAAGLQANARDHDYPDSALGLQRTAMRGWNVDFAYALGHASATASYGVDSRRSTTDWQRRLRGGGLALRHATTPWRRPLPDLISACRAGR